MKKLFTLMFATILSIASTFAQEVLLGQYHFNDATNYSEVGVDNAIVLNANEVAANWVVSINSTENGVYKAYNTSTRNLNQFPLGVSFTPKTGYIIQLSKIEVYHKTSATITTATQKFSYYLGTATTVASSTDLTTETSLPTSASFTLFTHIFSTPIQVSGSNKFWIYHRIRIPTYPLTATTEVDYIKFYGTFLDPTAPVINAALGIHNINAAKIGGNVSKVIDITHSNLTEGISTSSSNASFTAAFDDGGESGTYNALRVTYSPTTAGYETATITLTSGSATKAISVKGWGLPENAIAAWNFEDQTITPNYYSNTLAIPSIELIGGTGAAFLLQDTYMYEINNLYTTDGGVEVPEIAGIRFNNLGYNGSTEIKFDIRARNGSPNTLKVGDEYWRNPREAVGTELDVTIQSYVSEGSLSMVSAFDQTVNPKVFMPIKPLTAFLNTTGWGLDNIILMSNLGTSNINNNISKTQLYVQNGHLFIKNVDKKAHIDIISINGLIMESFEINSDISKPFNLEGIYLIRLMNNENTIIQKVIF